MRRLLCPFGEHGDLIQSEPRIQTNSVEIDHACCHCGVTVGTTSWSRAAWDKIHMKNGIPYSVRELELASSQPSDDYHRQLMRWAAKRIRTLEERLYGLADDIYPHTVDRDVKAGETIPVRISKPFMVRD